MSTKSPSDSPSPSPSAPRRSASTSPPRAKKSVSTFRGPRSRGEKPAPAAEEPTAEAAEVKLPEVAPAEEKPKLKPQAAEERTESERPGNRPENGPPQREQRWEQRQHDRGPRPNRHERPERSDRWDRPPPPRPERAPLDAREISEKAWQLFASELREEGVTFVDDGDAEKLTNRCFKLAEIFIRHRQRRAGQPSGPSFPEDRRRDEPRPQQSRPPQREHNREEPPTAEPAPEELKDLSEEAEGES